MKELERLETSSRNETSCLLSLLQEVKKKDNTCCNDEIQRTAEISAVCQSDTFYQYNSHVYFLALKKDNN